MSTKNEKEPAKQKRNKPGQPRKTVENCLPENWEDMILEMSAEGMSDVEIRAKLCMVSVEEGKKKFSQRVWYALQDRDERFKEILKIGKVLCQAWWEEVSRKNLVHSKFDVFETGSWYANMKNRFGWSDKNYQLTMNGTMDDQEFCNQFFGLQNGEFKFNGNGNGKHGNGKLKPTNGKKNVRNRIKA